MFHKIKDVYPLSDYKLNVQFANGTTKQYDLLPLMETIKAFAWLKDNPEGFYAVSVDPGGYGIVWNDETDLSCDELWEHGKDIETPFDNLMAMRDATDLWGLHESTLRKAISYGKLVNGVDVRKYGKQWVVSLSAMEREYGLPKDSPD